MSQYEHIAHITTLFNHPFQIYQEKWEALFIDFVPELIKNFRALFLPSPLLVHQIDHHRSCQDCDVIFSFGNLHAIGVDEGEEFF